MLFSHKKWKAEPRKPGGCHTPLWFAGLLSLLLTGYLEASLLFPNAPPSGVGGWLVTVTPPGLSLPLQCPQVLAHVFKFRSPDGKKLCTRGMGGRKWRWLFIPATPHFFSSLKHLPLSSVPPRGRWAGSQARPKLGCGEEEAGRGRTAPG